MASHRGANAVDSAQTTTSNIAGRVGHGRDRVASSLQQVADRAVESAEQTATTTGVAAILAGTLASITAVATIGHFYTGGTKITHLGLGSEDIKTI